MNETKQMILKVAGELMTQNGIKETSLAHIAKAVGISKGTLYYHYLSKDDIIYDIAENHLNEMTRELLQWIEMLEDDLKLEEVIHVVMKKIIESETRGKLHLYLMNSAILQNSHMKDRFKVKYKMWRDTLNEGINRVSSRKESNILACTLLAILDGLTIQNLLGIEETPYQEMAKALVQGY